MVFVEAPGALFKRDETGSGQNAGLPHAAAQSLAVEAGMAMSSSEPTSMEPTGAPRPFERQNMTVSKPRVRALTSTPRAMAALKMRAPSRWSGQLALFCAGPDLFQNLRGVQRPPARLAVFSISMSPVAARNAPRA